MLQLGVDVLPEGLVGFLRRAITRGPDNGDRAVRHWIGAVERDILFDRELVRGFLSAPGTLWVLSDVLPGNDVVNYSKGKRHSWYFCEGDFARTLIEGMFVLLTKINYVKMVEVGVPSSCKHKAVLTSAIILGFVSC